MAEHEHDLNSAANPVITEGNLTFTFGAGWKAIKYDDTPWYRTYQSLEAKGIDILAYDHEAHWWIEIKDCLNHESANLYRTEGSPEVLQTRAWVQAQNFPIEIKVSGKDFVSEMTKKTIDTMSGLAFANHSANSELEAYTLPATSQVKLKVVLFLTWEPVDFGRFAGRLKTRLKGILSSINVDAWVINQSSSMPLGLECSVERHPFGHQ